MAQENITITVRFAWWLWPLWYLACAMALAGFLPVQGMSALARELARLSVRVDLVK